MHLPRWKIKQFSPQGSAMRAHAKKQIHPFLFFSRFIWLITLRNTLKGVINYLTSIEDSYPHSQIDDTGEIQTHAREAK